MTTLPAKAGSFSGHARANAPRFVLKAPSEPQDILSGVNVPVCYVAARAAMHPLRERFLCPWKLAAVAAHLRGVPGDYPNDCDPSFFRFGSQDRYEPSPACIVRGLRKPGVGDTTDVEDFVDNEAVSIYQPSSLLVVEVSALVRRFLVQAGNELAGFAASVGAELLARHRALLPPGLLLSLPVVARRLYRIAL